MEWLSSIARPEVIGPLVGMVAVLGWAVNKALRTYFDHVERMEKIRMGMDPDDGQYDEDER